jgi:hypothetical protein
MSYICFVDYCQSLQSTRYSKDSNSWSRFLLGFFASLFFSCCPLAMIVLLGIAKLHSNTNLPDSPAFLVDLTLAS